MRVLITGVSGAGGSYLAEHILSQPIDVDLHGTRRTRGVYNDGNLSTAAGYMDIHNCELTDAPSVYALLMDVQPDLILHFASYANVRAAFDAPTAVIKNNIDCTLILLEAARTVCPGVRFVHCSTSEVYGQVPVDQQPITEEQPLAPYNPYGVSKTAQDMLVSVYGQSYGMEVVLIRPFGYLNPRRPDIVASAFARQIALIELGKQTELLHGNLRSERTFLDVRDAMAAFWMLADLGVSGEAYNVGGTEKINIGDLLGTLAELSDVPIHIRQDASLMRPVDIVTQTPDISKMQALTNWEPTISIEEGIAYCLEYWRKRVRDEA